MLECLIATLVIFLYIQSNNDKIVSFDGSTYDNLLKGMFEFFWVGGR